MNVFFLAAAIAFATPVAAQTSDGAKYARCSGSSEVQKCRALVDSMAAETPEAKRARIDRLEKERAAAARAVVSTPSPATTSSQLVVRTEPAIGMREVDVTGTSWGNPESINRTVTAFGTREQWVYGAGRYVYLENGRVISISTRR